MIKIHFQRRVDAHLALTDGLFDQSLNGTNQSFFGFAAHFFVRRHLHLFVVVEVLGQLIAARVHNGNVLCLHFRNGGSDQTLNGVDLFGRQLRVAVHADNHGCRRRLFFAGKHFAPGQNQMDARRLDLFDGFDRAGQFAFQRAKHLQVDNVVPDAGGLRLVKNFVSDDAAGIDRFSQLDAQFQGVRRRNLNFRAVFGQFVAYVLFVQLGDDFFRVGGIQFVEQDRHFRRSQMRRQINQKPHQEQQDAAHCRQPRHSQVFQCLQKRIHFVFPAEELFLAYSISGFY